MEQISMERAKGCPRLRKASEEAPEGARWLHRILVSNALPLPAMSDEGAFLDSLEPDLRAQWSAEVAYLRGDCGPAKERFRAIGPEDRTWLCACAIAHSAAVSSGDRDLWAETMSCLRRAVRTAGPGARPTAKLALTTATASVLDVIRPPAWLRKGDASAFDPEARPWAMYIHAKYLQAIRDFPAMLDTARATLASISRPGADTPLGVYLRLLCAAACYGLDDRAGMERWLAEALESALPHGLIMPFAETVLAYGDVLDQMLLSDWPGWRRAILMKSREVSREWLTFHNLSAQDDVALGLTIQEYHLAQLIANGLTYREAGRYMHLSLGRVRNLMSSIYGKLGIKRRADLGRRIL